MTKIDIAHSLPESQDGSFEFDAPDPHEAHVDGMQRSMMLDWSQVKDFEPQSDSRASLNYVVDISV